MLFDAFLSIVSEAENKKLRSEVDALKTQMAEIRRALGLDKPAEESETEEPVKD